MKTFKEFVSESVIKLRGFGGGDKSRKFFDDLDSISHAHPMNNTHRIIGDAAVHVSRHGDGVHLHDVYTSSPKSGAGTVALKSLTSLADKHNMPISGTAKAYSTDKSKITTSHRLKKWYEKHGFKTQKNLDDNSYNIHYTPNRKTD